MYILMSIFIDALNMSRKRPSQKQYYLPLRYLADDRRFMTVFTSLGIFHWLSWIQWCHFITVNLKEIAPFDFQDPSEHL